MKKILLSIGSAVSLLAPIAGVISCNKRPASHVGYAQLVTDGSPIEDQSFNQQARDAARDWGKENGKTSGATQSKSTGSTDLKVSWQAAVDAGTKMLITTGFGLNKPLEEFAQKHKNIKFVYVDGTAKGDNIISLIYKTEQAAFLAGIATGIMMTENEDRFKENGFVVGAWGGQDIQPIKAYIGGYQQGIKYYNKNIAKDDAHKIKWVTPGENRKSMISGSWDAGKGTPLAKQLLKKHADILLGVAGVQSNDAIQAIKEATGEGHKALIVGVDTDQTKALGADGKYAFTSIMKDVYHSAKSAFDVINGKKVEGIELGKTTNEGLAKKFVRLGEGLISKTDGAVAGAISKKIVTKISDENKYKENSVKDLKDKSIWEAVSKNKAWNDAATKATDTMTPKK